MKLKYKMSFQHVGETWVGVPIGEDADNYDGMLSLNDVGHDILQLLSDDTDADTIVAALLEQYDAEPDVVRPYVIQTLDLLRSHDLLV